MRLYFQAKEIAMSDDTRLNVRVPKDVYASFKAACALDHVTMSDKVIELVLAYLATKK
jgi:uncharacterized protein (DUF1778 family)